MSLYCWQCSPKQHNNNHSPSSCEHLFIVYRFVQSPAGSVLYHILITVSFPPAKQFPSSSPYFPLPVCTVIVPFFPISSSLLLSRFFILLSKLCITHRFRQPFNVKIFYFSIRHSGQFLTSRRERNKEQIRKQLFNYWLGYDVHVAVWVKNQADWFWIIKNNKRQKMSVNACCCLSSKDSAVAVGIWSLVSPRTNGMLYFSTKFHLFHWITKTKIVFLKFFLH